MDGDVKPLRAGDPEQVGAYRLIGRLGQGGMGTVYLAESADGERVAVKMINFDLAHDQSFRGRFRREVEAARRVRRFCTAPVLDAQIDHEPLYVVTQYVDGPTLYDFVRNSGPMHGSDLEYLAVGVATALSAIHGAGIVHRDLKPANVLLSAMGPRVIDFGIARALDAVTNATDSGHLVGTPAYMAPEVIEGGRATPASDVFAWGSVIAFAGTGKAPFSGVSMPAVLYRISHGEPDLGDLDPVIRPLVEKALTKDPSRRISVQALLDGLVGQEHADAAQIADSVGRSWQTDSTPSLSATISSPREGAGGSPTATLVKSSPAIPSSPDESPPPQPGRLARRRWVVLTGIGVAAAAVLALVSTRVFPRQGLPSSEPVYRVDFLREGTNWQKIDSPSYSTAYVDGEYRINLRTRVIDSEAATYRAELPAHALISADVSTVSGYAQVGLWCRGPDAKHLDGYVFLVDAGRKQALIRKIDAVDPSGGDLRRVSSLKQLRPTGANRLQIACEQAGQKVRLRLWLNGRFVTEYTDSDNPLSTGQAGVVAARQDGPAGDPAVADFDNFEIAQIKS